MGSPGAGKTAVLEATAKAAGSRLKLGAVSGDLATDRDADRLNASGIVSATITTGSACHLDARLVHRALHDFPSNDRDIFFIENVGNLVCPAIYDLGQAANVVALSVTEGEDKPLKYPVMFQKADLVLLTKIDLIPHLDFDVAAVEDGLARVMPEAKYASRSLRRPAKGSTLGCNGSRSAAGACEHAAEGHAHHHHPRAAAMSTTSLFASLGDRRYHRRIIAFFGARPLGSDRGGGARPQLVEGADGAGRVRLRTWPRDGVGASRSARADVRRAAL